MPRMPEWADEAQCADDHLVVTKCLDNLRDVKQDGVLQMGEKKTCEEQKRKMPHMNVCFFKTAKLLIFIAFITVSEPWEAKSLL